MAEKMEYVTQAAYARHRGVSRQAVHGWIKNGRITPQSNGKIDLEAADKQLAATESVEPHHQAHAAVLSAERGKKSESTTRPIISPELIPEDQMSDDEVSRRMKAAAMREREYRAEAAAISLDKQAGELVELTDVEFLIRDIQQTFRSALESLPYRLTPELIAAQGDGSAIHRLLADAAWEVQDQIAHHIERKMPEVLNHAAS